MNKIIAVVIWSAFAALLAIDGCAPVQQQQQAQSQAWDNRWYQQQPPGYAPAYQQYRIERMSQAPSPDRMAFQPPQIERPEITIGPSGVAHLGQGDQAVCQ